MGLTTFLRGIGVGLLLAGMGLPAWGQITDDSSKFLGNILPNTTAADPSFATYWNQVTPENSGKWSSVEGTRGVMRWTNMDSIHQRSRDLGIPLKQHTFVWGSQQPGWIGGLGAAEQRAEVAEWIAAYGARYPDTEYIDVVNEPLHAPPSYAAALGGSGATGWDWVIWSFEEARRACPGAKLLLNDYGIVGSNSSTTTYLSIINLLQARGLIDGIGVQCHGLEYASLGTVESNLGRLAATGLPVYVSELELDFSDDTAQRDRYEALFPVFWENPVVRGVTLWGYKENQIWRPDGYLVRANGSERPAMTWLKDYVAAARATVAFDTTAGDTTYSAVLGDGTSAPRGLVKSGPGVLTLSGDNTYTGDTTIGGGTLRLRGGAFSTAARYYSIASGAVLNLDGDHTIATGTTAIGGSGTLRITGGGIGNGTGSGRVLTFWLSPGALIDVAAGASLANGGWQACIWSGNSADLNVDGTFNMGDGSLPVLVGGLTGAGQIVKSWGSNTGILTVGTADGSGAFSGSIGNASGAISLRKVGAGTQILSGSNSYGGGTTISGGTLLATRADALPGFGTAGRVSVASNATLAVRAGGSGHWSSADLASLLAVGPSGFSGGSRLGIDVDAGDSFSCAADLGVGQIGKGLVKSGAGTLSLTAGVNSYTGLTEVAEGTLLVGGRLSGSLLVDGGATFSPGHSPGRAIVARDYSQGSGGVLLAEIGGRLAGDPAGYDWTDVRGTAAFGPGAIVDVNLVDGFVPQVGDTFAIVTAGSGIWPIGLGGIDFDFRDAPLPSAEYWGYRLTDGNKTLELYVGVVPEPGTVVLLGTGLVLVLGGRRWRRRRGGLWA